MNDKSIEFLFGTENTLSQGQQLYKLTKSVKSTRMCGNKPIKLAADVLKWIIDQVGVRCYIEALKEEFSVIISETEVPGVTHPEVRHNIKENWSSGTQNKVKCSLVVIHGREELYIDWSECK